VDGWRWLVVVAQASRRNVGEGEEASGGCCEGCGVREDNEVWIYDEDEK